MNVKIGILFVLIGIFAVVMFTNESYGKSLTTSPNVNKIGTLKVNDLTTKGVIGMNLGTSADIGSVTITFNSVVAKNDNVNIFFYDSVGTEIGSGTKIKNPAGFSITIDLTGTGQVTDVERITLRSITVTIT
jgi:hypothetical protein